jgi:hypothetical protein
MTLLARNEADIVDAQIAFHLHAGVDFVVATDNRSEDGTAEILEGYERAGVLRLLREEGDDMRQADWVTRMARLAATEHGAEWVLNTDADEFWWPRGGSLKEVLASVPERFGVVRGCWRHFLPRPDDDGFFAERMTTRLARPAHPGDKETVYHAHQKVAHRGHAEVAVEAGNHNAEAPGLEPLRGWFPIEVLHFSFRSVEQTRRKLAGGWLKDPSFDAALHQRIAEDARRAGREAEHYAGLTVDDDGLARGLADGTLAIDTRLRDALRALRGPDGGFVLPEPSSAPRLTFPRATAFDDAELTAELAPLHEIDGIVRAEQRVTAFERRLRRLESEPLARLESTLGVGGARPARRHRLAPR